MIKYFGYHRVPKFLLKPNAVLEVDLYIYLPTNEQMIAYRKAGDTLSDKDSAKLMDLQDSCVLTRDDFKDALTTWISKGMTGFATDETLAPNEPIDPAALTGTADALLGAFHPTFGAPVLEETGKQIQSEVEANPKELLNEVAGLVEQVLEQMKKAKSAAAYTEFVKSSKGTAMDPLIAHQRQVSALAVLILMSTGHASMNDLSELGTAGLVHDLGLNDITLTLRDQHLVGMDSDFTAPEVLVYRRHPDLVLDQMKARKVALTPAVTAIVQQHHENWDGSGFKGLSGEQINRSARALRIADDLVTWLSNLMNFSGTLLDAHTDLSKRGAIYDPSMMKTLGEALAQQ